MTKKEYAKILTERISDQTGWRCKVSEITKTNDTTLTAITIMENESAKGGPTFYIDDKIETMGEDDIEEMLEEDEDFDIVGI